jgi:hypothetical protein
MNQDRFLGVSTYVNFCLHMCDPPGLQLCIKKRENDSQWNASHSLSIFRVPPRPAPRPTVYRYNSLIAPHVVSRTGIVMSCENAVKHSPPSRLPS